MNLETATRLQQLRKKHGLSQEELAEQLGVSRQAVSKWERAESSPDTDNLICLAKLYGVSLDELLGIQPDTTKTPVEESSTSSNDNANDCEDEKDDEPKSNVTKALHAIIPILCTAIYLLLGGVWGWWHPSWIIFVAIPVLSSLVVAIEHKRFCAFAYPVFCVAVYLCLGFICGWWHPGWVIFVTIPVYYTIFEAVDKAIKK